MEDFSKYRLLDWKKSRQDRLNSFREQLNEIIRTRLLQSVFDLLLDALDDEDYTEEEKEEKEKLKESPHNPEESLEPWNLTPLLENNLDGLLSSQLTPSNYSLLTGSSEPEKSEVPGTAIITENASLINGLDISKADFKNYYVNGRGWYKLKPGGGWSQCTAGPKTWLGQMGYDVYKYGGWWKTPYSKDTTIANFIKNDPTHWKLVAHGYGPDLNNFKALPGDVGIAFAYSKKHGVTSHGSMMGPDGKWKSDFDLRHFWPYSTKGRLGNMSGQIWRYVSDGSGNGGLILV